MLNLLLLELKHFWKRAHISLYQKWITNEVEFKLSNPMLDWQVLLECRMIVLFRWLESSISVSTELALTIKFFKEDNSQYLSLTSGLETCLTSSSSSLSPSQPQYLLAVIQEDEGLSCKISQKLIQPLVHRGFYPIQSLIYDCKSSDNRCTWVLHHISMPSMPQRN